MMSEIRRTRRLLEEVKNSLPLTDKRKKKPRESFREWFWNNLSRFATWNEHVVAFRFSNWVATRWMNVYRVKKDVKYGDRVIGQMLSVENTDEGISGIMRIDDPQVKEALMKPSYLPGMSIYVNEDVQLTEEVVNPRSVTDLKGFKPTYHTFDELQDLYDLIEPKKVPTDPQEVAKAIARDKAGDPPPYPEGLFEMVAEQVRRNMDEAIWGPKFETENRSLQGPIEESTEKAAVYISDANAMDPDELARLIKETTDEGRTVQMDFVVRYPEELLQYPTSSTKQDLEGALYGSDTPIYDSMMPIFRSPENAKDAKDAENAKDAKDDHGKDT